VPPPPLKGPSAAQKKAQEDLKLKMKQRSSSSASKERTGSTISDESSLSSLGQPPRPIGSSKDYTDEAFVPPLGKSHNRKSSTDAFSALLSMATDFKGGDKKLDELQAEVHAATYNLVRVNKYNQRKRFAVKFVKGLLPKIEFTTSGGGRAMSAMDRMPTMPAMPGKSVDAEKMYELSAIEQLVRSSADPNHLRMIFREDKHPERLLVFRDGSERELFCYGASLLDKRIQMTHDCEEILKDGSVKYEVQLINQAGVRKTRALVVNDTFRHIVRHQGKDVKDDEVKDKFGVNEISTEPWSSDKRKVTIWYTSEEFRHSGPIKEMKVVKGAAYLKQMNIEFPSTAARERFLGHVLALQQMDKETKILDDLDVWVGTWNTGDKAPPKNNDDLGDWLGPAGSTTDRPTYDLLLYTARPRPDGRFSNANMLLQHGT
jgi:hypothetical protein